MQARLRNLAGVCAFLAALGLGCEDPQHFSEPEKHTEQFVDFSNLVMSGRQSLPADPAYVYHVTVGSATDMVHPHFEGHWTFADPEKPIDIYVMPASQYNSSQPPAGQEGIFWTSLTDAVVGQQRATSMHLHPTPGDWVIIFYNPAPNVLNGRSEIAAEVALTYFK
jgi:hypothetical protein